MKNDKKNATINVRISLFSGNTLGFETKSSAISAILVVSIAVVLTVLALVMSDYNFAALSNVIRFFISSVFGS